MIKQKSLRIVICLSLLILFVNISAIAQDGSGRNDRQLATASADSANVKWQPHVSYSRVVLTVSAPDGQVYRKEYRVGTTPSFSVRQADGVYTYELVFSPLLSRGVEERLATARSSGEESSVVQDLRSRGELPMEPMIQSGSFAVEKGVVIVGVRTNARTPSSIGLGKDISPDQEPVAPALTTIPDDLSVTGKVGIHTATPILDLQITSGDTPATRYEQNISGGFAAQTWDLGANEANFFVRDLTSSSRLPFRIRPGAPTSSLDISSTGKVGIHTSTPALDLHVASGDTPAMRFDQNISGGFPAQIWDVGANEVNFFVRDTTSSFNLPFRIRAGAPTSSLDISPTGMVGIGTSNPDQKLSVNGDASKVGGGSWQTYSDERLKKVQGRFNTGLKAVMQLQPIRYEYRSDNALGLKSVGDHVGFGAQSLQKVIPEAVTKNSDGYLMVNNDPIIWTMLNAIKEQQKEIERLKVQIRQLRSSSHKRRK